MIIAKLAADVKELRACFPYYCTSNNNYYKVEWLTARFHSLGFTCAPSSRLLHPARNSDEPTARPPTYRAILAALILSSSSSSASPWRGLFALLGCDLLELRARNSDRMPLRLRGGSNRCRRRLQLALWRNLRAHATATGCSQPASRRQFKLAR